MKNNTLTERREKLERLLAMQEPMERIIAKLPDNYMAVTATDNWIQISTPSREMVIEAMTRLNAGKWTKKVCHIDGGRVDYETTIEGIPVLMFCAEPPKSCKIETEEIEVPAHKEIRRTLVCA